MSSFLIESLVGQIAEFGPVVIAEQEVLALAMVLESVSDRRSRCGCRYRLGFVLTAAVSAVLAGCRSPAAIAQWTGSCEDEVLVRLGGRGRWLRPAATTFGRVFAALDGDDLDAVCGSWLAGLLHAAKAQTVGESCAGEPLQVAAADGKTVRGAGPRGGTGRPHLVALYRPADGCVIGQIQVPGKTNEIPALRTLIGKTGIAGLTITADALHCQRDTAQPVVEADGHYLLFVKGNQPSLLGWIRRAFTDGIKDPSHGRTTLDYGHGRRRSSRTGHARRGRPRALGRGSPAPHQGHHLRRGRLPGPHRVRTPRHGQPTQPGHSPAQTPGLGKHRRSHTPHGRPPPRRTQPRRSHIARMHEPCLRR